MLRAVPCTAEDYKRQVAREIASLQGRRIPGLTAVAIQVAEHRRWVDGVLVAVPSVIEVNVPGPENSVYEDGVFTVLLTYPPATYVHIMDYGDVTVAFVTPVFHPDVGEDGSVCAAVTARLLRRTSYSYESQAERVIPALLRLLASVASEDCETAVANAASEAAGGGGNAAARELLLTDR